MTLIPLDGREHPPETVWRAQELYCVCRLSYAKLSEELGVAQSTLKRWGQAYGWKEKRERIAQAECDIRCDTILARSEMLKELLEERNPLVGFAVAKLEDLALRQAAAEREGRAQVAKAARARRRIDTPAEAAAALKEAIEAKLGALLASPEDVDLKAVKEIKEALALLAQIAPRDGEDEAGRDSRGLSQETIERIQREILGMS